MLLVWGILGNCPCGSHCSPPKQQPECTLGYDWTNLYQCTLGYCWLYWHNCHCWRPATDPAVTTPSSPPSWSWSSIPSSCSGGPISLPSLQRDHNCLHVHYIAVQSTNSSIMLDQTDFPSFMWWNDDVILCLCLRWNYISRWNHFKMISRKNQW